MKFLKRIFDNLPPRRTTTFFRMFSVNCNISITHIFGFGIWRRNENSRRNEIMANSYRNCHRARCQFFVFYFFSLESNQSSSTNLLNICVLLWRNSCLFCGKSYSIQLAIFNLSPLILNSLNFACKWIV